MSINRALVDKARKYGKARTGRKVEGSTQFQNTGLDVPFRCRLTLPGSQKNLGAGGEPVNSVNVMGTMMTGTKDSQGALLSFTAGDEIEIESVELGTDRWMIWQDPEPLRKRRRMVGWQMAVHRFSQPQVQPERRVEQVRAVSDRMSVTDDVHAQRVRA